MIDNQKIKQKAQIERFKKKFYREHDIKLYVLTPVTSKSTLTLAIYKELTLHAIVEDHPKYKNYDFKTRTRERDFIMYIQVMSFLAFNDGYSKTSIGKAIFRGHATIINSCKTVSNGIETKDKTFCKILEKLQKKIDGYVGIITKDIKRKDDTKSSSDPIWDQARRFINQH
jgi:hypothetical protein